MPRSRTVACLALAALLTLGLTAPATAAPAKVRIGKTVLVDPPEGPALLVPVSYPIELAGRAVTLRVNVSDRGRTSSWKALVRLNAGRLRGAERRKRFRFVHTIAVGTAISEIRPGATVRLLADGRLDIEGDGRPERGSRGRARQSLSLATGHRICGSVRHLRVRPGERLSVRLPLCSGGTRWTIPQPPERGSLRLHGGKLTFRAPARFRGTVSATLRATPAPGVGATRRAVQAVPVRITVGAGNPVVRALGDSVTAGFGYYEHGEPMQLEDLLPCRPGETSYDDACSSNSAVRSNTAKSVKYSADFGLANNVSWVAQWANAHGVTNFKNYAVSGSEPSDWFGSGQFAATAKRLAGEDPDFVLLTLGANPLLSNMLFGIGNIGCGVWSDLFGRFQECIEEEFAEIKLRSNLKSVYEFLVRETDARILVMQYHLSIPVSALYTATQIAAMGMLLNREIAAAAGEFNAKRVTVVAPPHFDTGLDIEPVYPADYDCEGRFFSSMVDGPSVQSTASQDLLEKLHPIEFCPGPAKAAPWVISGDTGIHPSAAGYAQMASRVPAPGE